MALNLGEPPWRLEAMLAIALEEARAGLAEGGIPIGAALFSASGDLLGRGRNRRLQDGDPTLHAELVAFRDAAPLADYGDVTLATTLSPCWLCCGLIRQFEIGRIVVGDSENWGNEPLRWLQQSGAIVEEVDSRECVELLSGYLAEDAGRTAWQALPNTGR